MKTSIRWFVFAVTILLAPSMWAVSIYALTPDNKLLVIDGDVPANVSSIRAVIGLDAGDNLVGIDVRPATGVLYALSGDSSLYTIAPNTAAATKVADLGVALNGAKFGVDFNPVSDRLRIVSDANQNVSVNPTSFFVSGNTPLAYAAAPDRNAGADPNVRDIAYNNNFIGATGTTLFAIDDTTLDLVTQGGPNGVPAPNTGILISPVDPEPRFGHPLATHAGFDIAPNGTAYIVGVHPTQVILVAGDVETGALESRGTIGDGTIAIRDIAVAPTISFSAKAYSVFETDGNALITVKREGFVNLAASAEFTTHSDTASAASDYTPIKAVFNFPAQTVATSAGTVQTLSFWIPIIDDGLPEEDEFLDLFLPRMAGGQGVLGFPDLATLRINANDRIDKVGPQVEFIGLTGPSRGISGAVVHFTEDMDPVTATNVANYKLIAFKPNGNKVVKTFSAASYAPVGRKVTLALAPFEQTAFSRMALRVKGGSGEVADLAGNLLDGDRNRRAGGDAVQIFEVFSGTEVRLIDRDGDRVTIEITGLDPAPGKTTQLDGIRPVGGPKTQLTQFWIVDPVALISTVNGKVTRSRVGDGIVHISEIIGLDKMEFAPLSTNPAFQVGRLTFGPIATGTR